MSDSLIIWCPRPPDNANAREHWSVALRTKNRYKGELDRRRLIGLIPAPPSEAFARGVLSSTWFVFGRHGRLDPDNATRRMKPLIDWLVTEGYIAGDSAECLSILQPQQVKQRPPLGIPPLASVRLTLTPTPF